MKDIKVRVINLSKSDINSGIVKDEILSYKKFLSKIKKKNN